MSLTFRRCATMPVGMTADNWRGHPHAPWAFANPARFLPTARIRKAARRSLDIGDPLGMVAFGDDGGRCWTLGSFLRGTHADGFIVLHRGQIVFEDYCARTHAATRHMAFSITKALTGLLAELLLRAGQLDPNIAVGVVIPELAETAFADASLRALLDMRDGVGFDETYANPDADIHLYSRHFWGAAGGGVLAGLKSIPVGHRAGPGFTYRTPVIDVAGLMIEGQTGRTLPDLMQDWVWGPVGAANDGRWIIDTGGRAIASAGFACTLRDLARLGLAVAEAAAGSGPLAGASALSTGGDRAAFAAAGMPTRPGYSYRSGWWVDHPGGALNALGVFGQRLHVAPEDGVVIARFGSHPVASNEATDLLHAPAFAAIRAALRER